jgi:hypothetical protein
MNKQAHAIIAATFGADSDEMKECRYQPTRTTIAIYACNQRYFATGKTKPKDVMGGPWRKSKDQFWAEQAGTILWECDDITGETFLTKLNET